MRGIKAKQLRKATESLETDNFRVAYRRLKKLYKTDHKTRQRFND